ncbi:MAG TPA: D-glycerate dehydrogenase [Iamia sp.]
MSRVVVTTALPPGSLDPLHDAGHSVAVLESAADLSSAVAEADALITLLTDTVDRDVLAAGAGRLSVVANVAAGYDNIDIAAAAALGITVCATPGILDESTAELAFALALMARRRTTDAEATLRAGRWDGWAIDGFLGHDLLGATMGIVGWGRIGRAVARRADAFGMDVVHTSRHPTGGPGYLADVDELFRTADVVSLHVPLTPSTRGLVSAERLRLMKPTAVLVNTARGAVVDEAALAEALHDGVIFGAGLDVHADEPTVHPRLLDAPGAVLLPHVGSATVRTRSAMARTAATAVVDVLAGRPSAAIVPPQETP